MTVEYQEWKKKKPGVHKVFCVYEPLKGHVTMVRVIHPDDLAGDVTWCPHSGKECFGDVPHDSLWCYAPEPRLE